MKDDPRAITRSQRLRDRAAMMSSATPSPNTSSTFAVPALMKGRDGDARLLGLDGVCLQPGRPAVAVHPHGADEAVALAVFVADIEPVLERVAQRVDGDRQVVLDHGGSGARRAPSAPACPTTRSRFSIKAISNWMARDPSPTAWPFRVRLRVAASRRNSSKR